MKDALEVQVECEYCSAKGSYGQQIELRLRQDGSKVFACKDVDACDKRWFQDHAEEDEEYVRGRDE